MKALAFDLEPTKTAAVDREHSALVAEYYALKDKIGELNKEFEELQQELREAAACGPDRTPVILAATEGAGVMVKYGTTLKTFDLSDEKAQGKINGFKLRWPECFDRWFFQSGKVELPTNIEQLDAILAAYPGLTKCKGVKVKKFIKPLPLVFTEAPAELLAEVKSADAVCEEKIK